MHPRGVYGSPGGNLPGCLMCLIGRAGRIAVFKAGVGVSRLTDNLPTKRGILTRSRLPVGISTNNGHQKNTNGGI